MHGYHRPRPTYISFHHVDTVAAEPWAAMSVATIRPTFPQPPLISADISAPWVHRQND